MHFRENMETNDKEKLTLKNDSRILASFAVGVAYVNIKML